MQKLNCCSNSITGKELSSITVPVLVVNGGVKDIVPKSEAEYISSEISDCELLILEKSGHCNYIFNNNLFYEKLFSFLAK